ncbi:MAG TPA: hypothetical protein DHV48_11415 [Prolixibacteraceae bacterium]|nr:hypothetical protein [Prolixibacteraceae bacterium]
MITALIPAIAYEKASEIVKNSKYEEISIMNAVLKSGLMNELELNNLIDSETACELGS